MKFEVHGVQGFKLDYFLVQKLLLAVLDSSEKLAAGFGDILGIGLPFENDLHVHLWAQFLVCHMNRNFMAANLTQETKQLPPKPVELARIRIFGQPPAPE